MARDAQPKALEGEVTTADGQRSGPGADVLALANQDDLSLAAGLTKAEIDQQISTAKRYPRVATDVRRNIETMATLDHKTAVESVYSLPRSGKEIIGPSVRFAEIVAQAWGNCRVASRVTNVGKTHLEATGIYHDLETNVAYAKSVTVRITDKYGKRYNDDMIGVASAAATSKALRNAILTGVPKAVWRAGFDKALGVIAGDVATIGQRTQQLLGQFQEQGATPDQVWQLLGIKGPADMTVGLMVRAAGLYTALETGEATLDQLLADAEQASQPAQTPAPKTLGNANGQKADPPKEAAKPAKAAQPPKEQATPPKEPDPPAEPDNAPSDAESGPADDAQPEATEGADDQATDPGDESAPGDDAAMFDQQADDGAADTQGDADQGDDMNPDLAAFHAALDGAKSWDDVRSAVHAVAQTTYWREATGMEQAVAYRAAWNVAADTPGTPDPAKDVGVFRLWLEGQDSADLIEKTWSTFASSTAYGKLPQGARDSLINAKQARKKALGA